MKQPAISEIRCSKQLLNDFIFICFSDKKVYTLSTPKNSLIVHMLQQRRKTSEQNVVFAQSNGDRLRVEIGLHRYRSVIFVDPGVEIDGSHYKLSQ